MGMNRKILWFLNKHNHILTVLWITHTLRASERERKNSGTWTENGTSKTFKWTGSKFYWRKDLPDIFTRLGFECVNEKAFISFTFAIRSPTFSFLHRHPIVQQLKWSFDEMQMSNRALNLYVQKLWHTSKANDECTRSFIHPFICSFFHHPEQTSIHFTKTLIDFLDGWYSILLLFWCGGGGSFGGLMCTIYQHRKHQQCQPNVNEMSKVYWRTFSHAFECYLSVWVHGWHSTEFGYSN